MSQNPREPSERASRPARREQPGEAPDPPGSAETKSTRTLSQATGQNLDEGRRLSSSQSVLPGASRAVPVADAGPTVFVPSAQAPERRPRRWPLYGSIFLFLAAIVAVGIMVAWPKVNPLRPRSTDPVEQVAADYLKALSSEDSPTIKKLGTVEEPPAIRSFRNATRNPAANQVYKGSFAPLGQLHARIDSEYSYDPSIARFTPKNPMGLGAELLDKGHEAKADAEKSGLYKKMQSGDPEEIFDAAEQFGKVFTQLAEGALAPKKIVPTYKMLVDDSKPPLPADVKAIALEVAAATKDWDALLKRSFHTLKADGPFVFERAEVFANATDRLASSGDPPSRLKLTLVRFRLEGIDTGWKVTSIKRVLPGDQNKKPEPAAPPASQQPYRSPGETPSPYNGGTTSEKN